MATKPNQNAAENLIDDILGTANPGDDGTADDDGDGNLGNEELHGQPGLEDDDDTGPVSKSDEKDDDDDDDNGADPDNLRDDPPSDDDPIAKAARDAQQGRDGRQQQDDRRGHPPSQNVDLFHPKAQIQRDKAGNLYHNGKIVARAGREARNFLGWRKQAVSERTAAAKMGQKLIQVAEGARELLARYNALNTTKTMFDNAGVTPQEQAQVLAVAQAYKKNPIDGIKMLLTQAHMSGVDIKSITGANSAALDPTVLMKQFEDKIAGMLKPVLDDTSQRANQNAARTEASGFFERNPDAADVSKIVGGSHKLGLILKEAKRKAPDLSLDELFQRLHYELLRQGGGRLPNTGPVMDRDTPPNKQRQQQRRMDRNFKRSVSDKRDPANMSYDDIGKTVLRDIALAESRGN